LPEGKQMLGADTFIEYRRHAAGGQHRRLPIRASRLGRLQARSGATLAMTAIRICGGLRWTHQEVPPAARADL
jgi:hypothetical protein